MNLKKLVITVVAALTATMAFAQSPISEEQIIQTETQQAVGVFFQEFSQRITDKKTTASDKDIIQAMENHVADPLKRLGSFLVKIQNEEEVSDEELEATLLPIENALEAGLNTLTETIIQSLDFNKINEAGPEQLQRTVALLIGMGQLDLDTKLNYIQLTPNNISQEIVKLSAFMTSLGYLTETGKLTEEEVSLISTVLMGGLTGEEGF